jgi:voltage-gated potassium channel
MPQIARPNLMERRMSRFLSRPPSVKSAAGVIVVATVVVVAVGGSLMRVLDHDEYSTVWVGMWWALQTVTTVGYGDVTPRTTVGRLIGTVVMVTGIGFLSVVTAAITAAFVESARQRLGTARPEPVADELRAIRERLERIERRLDER